MRALVPLVLAASVIAAAAAAAPAEPPAAPPASPQAESPPPEPPRTTSEPPIQPRRISLRLKMGEMANISIYAPTMSRPDLLPVIFFAGDWGFRPLQQETASWLAREGRLVLGIDSPEYFKKRLENYDWAADLKTLRDLTNEKAGRPAGSPVLLLGYGWGGEVIPYMLNRGGTAGFAGALLLGPDRDSAFIFRVNLQMGTVPSPPDETFDVGEELKRLPPSFPVAFIEGELDKASAAKTLQTLVPGPHKLAVIPGTDRQFREVRDIYLIRLGQALAWIESPKKN